MQEITLADHADDPVVLIDDRDRADAALGQHSRYCRYSRILIDRDHFTRHYVASAHRNPLGWFVEQQDTGQPASRIDPDQPVRVEGECGAQLARRVAGIVRPALAGLTPQSLADFPVNSRIRVVSGKFSWFRRQEFPVPPNNFPVRPAWGIDLQAIDIKIND